MGDRDRPHGRLLLGLGFLVLLVFLAGCSYYVPPVCGPCNIDGPAHARDVNVTQGETTATIDVRADGTARWTIRTPLDGPDVDTLRSNASLTEGIVRDSIQHWDVGSPERVRNLSTAFEGETLIVRYEVPNMADRYPGGVVVFDEFHRQSDGSQFGYRVEVDRVVLHGPNGSVLANRPPNGQIDGDAVSWEEYVDRRTYVAFAPDRSLASRIATARAIGTAVAGWLVVPVLVGSAVPQFLLVPLATLLVVLERGDDRPHIRSRSTLSKSGLTAIAFVLVLFGILSVSPETLTDGHVLIGVLVAPVFLFGILASVAESAANHHGPVIVLLTGNAVLVSLMFVIAFGGTSPAGFTTIWGFS